MTQDEPDGSVVDHIAPKNPAPDTGPAEACRPDPPRTRLTARFQPALNAALWQNHVPMLSELAVANAGEEPLGDIEIELGCQPPVLRARTWRAAGLAPGQIRTFDDLDVPVDGPLLSGLSEATRGTVSLTARSGGEIVGEFTQDIRILAFNEWGGTAGIPDILAAFVQPNDPAVARIIHAASDLLRAAGRADSFEGYQASSKARVWDQAQAIWNAVCRPGVLGHRPCTRLRPGHGPGGDAYAGVDRAGPALLGARHSGGSHVNGDAGHMRSPAIARDRPEPLHRGTLGGEGLSKAKPARAHRTCAQAPP